MALLFSFPLISYGTRTPLPSPPPPDQDELYLRRFSTALLPPVACQLRVPVSPKRPHLLSFSPTLCLDLDPLVLIHTAQL